MKTLSLALYCEGSTDRRFLPPIIARTSRRLLDNFQRFDIEVLPISLVQSESKKQKEAILLAAREAAGHHLLIIHSDADYPNENKARTERFEPGYQLVQQAKEPICKDLVPIIPVQAIEAWMLADYEQLQIEIGTKMNAQSLGIPEKARQVETIAKPKQKLREVVQRAYADRTKRHREIEIDILYQPFGEHVRLDRLAEVPAYQRFVSDLTLALRTLNFIQ